MLFRQEIQISQFDFFNLTKKLFKVESENWNVTFRRIHFLIFLYCYISHSNWSIKSINRKFVSKKWKFISNLISFLVSVTEEINISGMYTIEWPVSDPWSHPLAANEISFHWVFQSHCACVELFRFFLQKSCSFNSFRNK